MNSLLTVSEVSSRLSISSRLVYKLISLGKLPGVVRLGGALRFDPAAIERLVAEGGAK